LLDQRRDGLVADRIDKERPQYAGNRACDIGLDLATGRGEAVDDRDRLLV